MKILHLWWHLQNGGISNMLTDIVNEQSKTQDVSVCFLNYDIDKQLLNRIKNNVQVIILKRRPRSINPIPIIKLNWLIWKNRYDIIHYHGNLNKYVIIKNCPWYFTAHNQLWGNKDLHMFNEIGAISKSVYDSLINGGKKNVVLINNGINTTQIKQKQKWFKNMSVFRIVQVSRLTVWFKGQDLLIKAAAQLVRENIKDFHIDLIGEGEDYQLLNNMISEMKMEQYVTLLGNQTREYIYNQLANYDLYIQASRNDGFALSVAEAMVAKVPVLVSNIYGPKILVEEW